MTKKFSQIKFITFDIESIGFDQFLIGGIYDGKNFQHTGKKGKIDDLIKLIFSTCDSDTIAYAHFGGIFDFIHLLDFLFRQNTPTIDGIILQGSKILKMSIELNKKKITFIDSSGLFPFSLDKLTKSFGVQHAKIEHDVSNLKEVTNDLITYLYHDCVGLYECLHKYFNQPMLKDINHQSTRSGISFNIYKKHYSKYLSKICGQTSDFVRRSYFGGRTEIFKPYFKSETNHLYHYDINSLYPSVMAENDFTGDSKFYTDEFYPNELGVYKITVETPKDLLIPLLGIEKDGKYIFPLGTFTGYFCSPEILKALKLGYKIKKVHRGIVFENQGKIFKEFVDKFYTLRKNTKCPVENILYKDILNHLYGRLGINTEREQVSFEPNDTNHILSEIKFSDYVIRLYSETKNIKIYSNPTFSSFVTCYARLKLYSYFEKVGFENCYYCDTDSLFTTKKLEDSRELGKMKLENMYKEACFLLPKSYSTIDLNNVQNIKLKGIPHKSINHIDISTFFESISGEMRLPSFKINKGLSKLKTAFKSKKGLLHTTKESIKKISTRYDKRIIFMKGGEFESKPRFINGTKDIT